MPQSPFARAYDFEKLFKLERLKITIEKAEEAYASHEPETIDFCKCIIESLCKQILTEKGETYLNKHGAELELPQLIKKTLLELGFKNETIRGAIGGFVKGIGEIRNDIGMAGHGAHGSKPLPKEHDISLFVSIFQSITTILWHSFKPEDIDLVHTQLAFETIERKLKLGWFNQNADENVTVEYSKEDGLIFIEGKELRPSEILYHFDRETYAQKIKKSKAAKQDQFTEQLQDIIVDQLTEGVFDSFEPHAYGWEWPEVWLDETNFDGETIFVKGSISTLARLGASSTEDGIDIEYDSDFTASFSTYNDEDIGEFVFKLEEINIEKSGWIDDSFCDAEYQDYDNRC